MLESWISNNGWASYDPYDVREYPVMRKLERSFIARRFVHAIEMLNPLLLRKIFRVEKKINAKAMGLLADAYLNLFLISGNMQYKKKSEEYLNWLTDNYLKNYAGKCWGYPFDWQSKKMIPKHTPSGVVTAIVGAAYWKYYKTFNDNKCLRMCEDICNFFLKDLNIYVAGRDMLCFSYTPLDKFHVNNANLFVAEFLIKIGIEIKKQEFINRGLAGVNYTLAQQNNDGSIFYWGKEQNEPNSIDHYHSGFEMRCLYSVWLLTQDVHIKKALSKYYAFYLNHMFHEKKIPKHTPSRLNPIDIHSCSEAILCNTLLLKEFPEGGPYLKNSMEWILKNMQKKDGSFIYRLFILRGVEWRVDIPYMRWGQSWMLNALTSAMLYFTRK